MNKSGTVPGVIEKTKTNNSKCVTILKLAKKIQNEEFQVTYGRVFLLEEPHQVEYFPSGQGCWDPLKFQANMKLPKSALLLQPDALDI